jgi:ABC-type multidrug transport system fused ATPase/permease subunit
VSIFQNSLFKTVVARRHSTYFIIIIICLIISSVLGFLTPSYINDLYNSYGETSSSSFERIFKILAIIFIGEYLVRVVYQLIINKYVSVMLTEIRGLCYERWLLAYETIEHGDNKKDRFPLGEVLARLMNDTESFKDLVTSGTFSIFIDIFYIISCLISFISLNTTSGIFLIIAEVVACGALIYGSKYMARIFMETRKATSKLSRRLADMTGGFEDTYYTPHENYASKKSLADCNFFLEKQLKANVWDASYFSLAESLYPLLLAFLVFIFPYSQIVEVGIFAAIIDLIQRSISPIKSVAAKITNIQRARTGFERIDEFTSVLASYPMSKMEAPEVGQDFNSLKVSIEKFSYDNSGFELKDVEFIGKKGELIGLVGMSGCGKSTILKILSCNIICPDSSMQIDTGHDLIELDAHNFKDILTYRKYISIVSQESHVFTESLRFNITLKKDADPKFTKFFKEVCESIKYLKSWGITEDYLINPKELSSGQKQLLSALRSCYLNKPIVLFDEISSSMDADLELALRELVLIIQKQALTIIVAHRVETIVGANKILVLDEGRLIDSGDHVQLLERCDIYQKFIQEIQTLS